MPVDPDANSGQLREQLRRMLAQARDNERLMRRLQLFELKLIQAGDMRELAYALLSDYRRGFALDAVTLVLVDSGYEQRRMLLDAGIEPDSLAGLSFLDGGQTLERRLHAGGAPVLGRFDPARHADYVVACQGDPVWAAVRPQRAELTELLSISVPGQSRCTIYKRGQP